MKCSERRGGTKSDTVVDRLRNMKSDRERSFGECNCEGHNFDGKSRTMPVPSPKWSLIRMACFVALMSLFQSSLFLPVHGSHLPPSYLNLRSILQEVSNGGEEGVEVIFDPIQSLGTGSNSEQDEEEVTTTVIATLMDDIETDNTEIVSSTTLQASTSTSPTTLASTTTPTSTPTSTPTTPTPSSTPTTRTSFITSTTEGQGRLGEVVETLNGKRYLEISATCDSHQMFIFGQFVTAFKGRIYALGYPDETEECGGTAFSNPGQNVTFTLPLGQCGVQMMGLDPEFDSPKRHDVTLYVQYSSFLQQVIDDKVSVSCVEVQRSPLEESMQILDFSSPHPNFRQGRRMMGSVKDTKTGKPLSPSLGSSQGSNPTAPQTRISSKIGESWMEILHGKDPSPKSRKMIPVAVGQDVTLVISTKVMRGYDARIVNCSANDGSRLGSIDGFRSQQVLDSAGCSVDTTLVPNFRRRRLPIESRNRMITLHFATFPAFKFPERDHLHVKCMVAYCQGPCPQEPCDSGLNHFGTWRDKYGRIADALVDTAEIVNSVEVYAPELEDGGNGDHHYERHQSLIPLGGSVTSTSNQGQGQGRHLRFSDTKSAAHSTSSDDGDDGDNLSLGENKPPSFLGGGSVCVSPGSIILALVILGVVLVISATATLWFALKRSEARKYRQAVKHAPFNANHAGVHQPYYRFSHW